ncbi:E3 ubiquitin-protein ligase MARCH1-like [Pogonomyrmex barbatus]|uniref:E3 ubiquitin-protein ligase MARCH1-like n=1 Tax=Pogonomyrmex barbatus TaxID=144034 RepID=A0A6I9X746_9HYME|nr:E3 ubiquitin-protein ligase MARCH1-like [Pogonomyrmex barbatus]
MTDMINAYEMNEHSSGMERTSESNVTAFNFLCRGCNRDDRREKLIRPCNCTGDREFIHTDCLETLVRVEKLIHCIHCRTFYPLEYKRKRLIEWCRNVHALGNMLKGFFACLITILVVIFYNACILCLLIYLSTYINFSKGNINSSFAIIILMAYFVTVIILSKNMEKKQVISNSKRLRNACHTWYRENSHAKVIKSNRIRIF